MEEKLYELKIPNGVGERELAKTIEQFDVKLKQTEMGPKILGSKEELEKALQFLTDSIKQRIKELEWKEIIVYSF